ncbi:MAG TPA: RluA family pseudouridine synthase, partial [Defluviitaleaceae bacterium]|nr:RluA family pseudouridine synthase [Defluviitaleaceae bacterium]
MKEIIISENEANQRLDKFLMKYMNQSPKSFIYKMLRKKRIKYNGKKAYGNEKLACGDSVQLYLTDETISNFQKEKQVKETKQSFSIIYEDENILICNKPLGIIVHGSQHKNMDTLMDELLFYLVEKGEYDPNRSKAFTPAICNRLDRNTSGIVIVGKTLGAVQGINQMLKENKIKKLSVNVMCDNKNISNLESTLKNLSKNNIYSYIRFVDYAKTGSYDFSSLNFPLNNINKTENVEKLFNHLYKERENLKIENSEILLEEIDKKDQSRFPSNWDCNVEDKNNFKAIGVDFDGRIRLCKNIRGRFSNKFSFDEIFVKNEEMVEYNQPL